MIQRGNPYVVTEFKTKYADTTDLLRHLKHMHRNISTCTRKETEEIDIKFRFKLNKRVFVQNALTVNLQTLSYN